MELALAQNSIYIPPLLVGFLFYVYRKSILSLNPWNAYNKVITVISNTLTRRSNEFLEVLRVGSHLVYKTLNALQLQTVRLLQGPLLVYQRIQAAFQNLTFQFEVVKIQFSNFTQAAFTNFSKFFNPPEKTFWEKAYIPIVIITSLIVIGITWWYFTKNNNQVITVPEDIPAEAKIAQKQIRRRRRT